MLHSALEIIDVLDTIELEDGSYVDILLMSDGTCTTAPRPAYSDVVPEGAPF